MKPIVVSGIRATGKLHLGNYLGAMRNFVLLQQDYECYFFIADWHSLTTEEDAGKVKDNLLPIVIDYLAAGLDPRMCAIFAQSSIPEIPELALLLSMVEPVSDLEVLPTYKEKMELQKKSGKTVTAGLFFYPILMAADILIQKATVVPVGKDQLPHIFCARDIAQRFNARFGITFPLPNALEGKAVRVPGLDGTNKMGKSQDNTIELVESEESITMKLATAVTDPARKRRNDPGNPFECNIFDLHELVSPPDAIEWAKQGCKSAGIGCLECKKKLSEAIVKLLAPFQERRAEIAAKPGYAEEILHEGTKKARFNAKRVLEEVREKMGLKYFEGWWRDEPR